MAIDDLARAATVYARTAIEVCNRVKPRARIVGEAA
jgi:hypothetical protein